MAQAQSGTPRHHLTPEERARGASAGGKARAAKYQHARLLAAQHLAAVTEKALIRLEKLVDDENAAISFRATREVLDRVLGRSGQPLEMPIDPEDASPLRHKHGVTLGDVLKLSLAIGIDPITEKQDETQGPELLRRYGVPEDDPAWDHVLVQQTSTEPHAGDARVSAAPEVAP